MHNESPSAIHQIKHHALSDTRIFPWAGPGGGYHTPLSNISTQGKTISFKGTVEVIFKQPSILSIACTNYKGTLSIIHQG